MNATQVGLVVLGVLVLFVGPMFLAGRLANRIMFPRSLVSMLAAVAFFPLLIVLALDWAFIVIIAEKSAGPIDAVLEGVVELLHPPLMILFLVVYGFCALICLPAYFMSRRGVRGGRAFAAARGLRFTQDAGAFRLSPPLGSIELQLRNVVNLPHDGFVGAFIERVPTPGTSARGYTFMSIGVGSTVRDGLSGAISTASAAGSEWRALLDRFLAVDAAFANFGSVAVHEGQVTLLGGPLSSKADYERMASLLAAAGGADEAIS